MAARRKPSSRSSSRRSPSSARSRSSSSARSYSSSRNSNSGMRLVKSNNISISSPCNKSQLTTLLCEMTGQTRKEIQNTLECLQSIITAHMKRSGPGEFVMPGMLKIKTKYKPATKARKGINPFTGEPTTFKAKPARNVVKITALKKLKEIVN